MNHYQINVERLAHDTFGHKHHSFPRHFLKQTMAQSGLVQQGLCRR
ncbi:MULTISPECIES: hypothetical protein [Rhizobium/Agrobacterium group]|nr:MULTISPECIES: hypothetical protein [Rhizobium/Agrobacterium group]MUO92825.1 hypothetical protein [Agrobacterium vitis]MUZ54250.1 hypothetical protein [Agrobacterium vitis]MUZ93933.1 hypothetical protein [Agrobacterium vitis]MVA41942.1 hypothetical protein [Agrobacterium vitis]MVA48020.1 hypothetical protein [Agrobacterium vitis]